MLAKDKSGFSLVEILVSLFVVSLAAVNISGLQKLVGDQNRDNFAHTAVVALATEKFEELMQYKTIAHIDLLTGAEPTDVVVANSTFSLDWTVSTVTGAGDDIRDVKLEITWLDATDTAQTFTYSEQISLVMLQKGGSGGDWNYIIPNLLGTNKVNYFESKVGYKKDAYVIYNSQLFHATSVHSVGNGKQRNIDAPIDSDGNISTGWENLGQINNAELADLFTD
ncbi:MAG: prepilin-type N-terminal cleavage/methylation domain-containing protein [Alteromonadales bacterium]|nr:prepilin-type N-terminal cleavage/methylation domain-containing protein [Alteromonadales bacterium]